ncbi:MAG: SRPBCC family protein [Acidimicrobiia bacterium]
MDTLSVETDIAAAPETVWSLISDITRMGEWSPESTGGKWKGGASGPAVGAKFAGTNANGKKSWSTDCEVTDCEPGRTFGFRVTAVGLKIARWNYVIEPTPTGSHVTETWTDDRGGFAKFAGKLASGVADRAPHNRAGMEQTLAALKAAAEHA